MDSNLETMVTTVPHNSVEKITQGLLSLLNNRGICYAILGNPADYPKIETDIDLCTDRPYQFIETVRDFCKLEGSFFLNLQYHATGIRCDLAAISDSRKLLFFPGPDILLFPAWRIKGAIGLSYSELLRFRVWDPRGFFCSVKPRRFHFLSY